MTKHPGKTGAQRRVLDMIGCGNNSPLMSKSTREALLRDGLIVQIADSVIGQGPLACRVSRFEMPISVHMQWCQHHSEQINQCDQREDDHA